MEQTLTQRFTPRMAIGLTLLWLGSFWLLSEIGFHLHPFAHLWPIGVILLAVAIALHGGGWVSTLFVGGIGVWLLSESLDLFRFDLGDLWPLVLVFFGARLIMKGVGIRNSSSEATAERVRSTAIFGNREHLIESDRFQRGDATAILGASNIDLGAARFPDGATIDLFCLAGGINIRVSRDTRVVSDVVPFMAGYEDKRRTHEPATQTLYLRGVVMWGGVEVLSSTQQPGALS